MQYTLTYHFVDKEGRVYDTWFESSTRTQPWECIDLSWRGEIPVAGDEISFWKHSGEQQRHRVTAIIQDRQFCYGYQDTEDVQHASTCDVMLRARVIDID